MQHRGSTRCRVHLAKVHWCKGVKGDRGWPVRAAHIEEFPVSWQAASRSTSLAACLSSALHRLSARFSTMNARHTGIISTRSWLYYAAAQA